MHLRRIAVITLASLLAAGPVAAPALARDHHGDRGHDRRGHQHDRGRHDDRRSGWDQRRGDRGRDYRDHRDRRGDDRYYHDRHRGHAPVVVYRPAPPRPVVVHHHHARPHHWARGQRYRDYYQGPVYVVHDYPRYHLRQPPRGYHWVRDDRGNMLMVAIATGIIADLLLHH